MSEIISVHKDVVGDAVWLVGHDEIDAAIGQLLEIL